MLVILSYLDEDKEAKETKQTQWLNSCLISVSREFLNCTISSFSFQCINKYTTLSIQLYIYTSNTFPYLIFC